MYSDSKLVKKYNETIDRESAYEMLNAKIEKAEEIRVKEEERLEKEKERASSKRRSSGSGYKRQNPIVKVLTSATFIRAVFGILKKVV